MHSLAKKNTVVKGISIFMQTLAKE